CHDIPGHGEDAPAGSELSDYGDKRLEDLDFGPRADIPRSVESWTLLKLLEPRAFGGELFMPRPYLSREEALAVTGFLLGLTKERIPDSLRPGRPFPFEAAGEAGKIIRDRRCLTCHSLGRRGGDFAPELDFEGSRVNPSWLESFLKEPTSIRPRLVQMPQLQLPVPEVRTLVRFFQYAARKDDLESLPPLGKGEVPLDQARGARLLEEKGCLACHKWKEKGGILGADIEKAGERLRPGFVYHWILDPRGADRDSMCPRSGMSHREAAFLARFLTGGKKP
ncbi:MAG TPA: c-type cytochrome, partial [Planctomycetes bacterium]|nr:c-type cytochrome [Planctomycetota bacterium]